MNWKRSFVLISMTIFSYNFAPNKIDEEPPRKRAKITNFVFNLFKFRRGASDQKQTTTTPLPTEAKTTTLLSPANTPESTSATSFAPKASIEKGFTELKTSTPSAQAIPLNKVLSCKKRTSLQDFITKASSVSSVRKNATTEEITNLLDQISKHKNCHQIFSEVQTPIRLSSTSHANYFDYIFGSFLSSKRNSSSLYSQLSVAFILCQILNMRSHLKILSQFFKIDETGVRRLNSKQIQEQAFYSKACVFNALGDALLLINQENIKSNIMCCRNAVKVISKLADKLYDLLTKSRDGESFIANHISSLNLNATNLLEATTDLIAICCYVEKTILSGNSTSWAEYFLSDTTTINVDKVLEDLDEIPAEAQKLINRLEQRTN